jgi:hypothetical protein
MALMPDRNAPWRSKKADKASSACRFEARSRCAGRGPRAPTCFSPPEKAGRDSQSKWNAALAATFARWANNIWR